MAENLSQLAPPVIAVVMILWFVWKIVEAVQHKRNGKKKGEQLSCPIVGDVVSMAKKVSEVHEVMGHRRDGERLVYGAALKGTIEKLAGTIDTRWREQTDAIKEQTEAIRDQTRWMERLGENQRDLKLGLTRVEDELRGRRREA